MDPPLEIKILPESNPLESGILARRLAVRSQSQRGVHQDSAQQVPSRKLPYYQDQVPEQGKTARKGSTHLGDPMYACAWYAHRDFRRPPI